MSNLLGKNTSLCVFLDALVLWENDHYDWHILDLLCIKYHFKCFINIIFWRLVSPKKVALSLNFKTAVIEESGKFPKVSSRTRMYVSPA